MNKLLLWVGVILGVWSLCNSGHKSIVFVLGVLAYIAIVCFITFSGKAPKINIDEDFSQPKAG